MQEVIVYRNPAEAALWSAFMDGTFLPIIVGALVFLIAIVVFDKKVSYQTKQKFMPYFLVVSAVLGFGTAYGCYKFLGFF